MRASLPTLNALLDAGRPGRRHLPPRSPRRCTRREVQPRAGRRSGSRELLGKPVAFATDTVGESAQRGRRRASSDGEIALLENLRFNAGGDGKDADERDAFAAEARRLRRRLRLRRIRRRAPQAGERLRARRAAPERCRPAHRGRARRCSSGSPRTPEKPYTVVLGGSKVSDKLGVIGAPAAAGRLAAHRRRHALHLPRGPGPQGRRRACSRPTRSTPSRATSPRPSELGVEIVLPTDVVVASKFGADAEHVVTAADAIEETPFGASGLGLDIGPDTAARFAEVIAASKTVFWNGPMGVFELAPFAAGTKRRRRGAHRGRRPRRRRRWRLRRRRARPRLRRMTSSVTSPPVAAPASSSSRASASPDWRSSDGS